MILFLFIIIIIMTDLILSSQNTIGVDEVGRGTLFGNVVACAVILPEKFNDDI